MVPKNPLEAPPEGLLLVDKPVGRTSFSLVPIIRKKSGQKKVGHAGTLDPFASGLLVFLLGRSWTRKADSFLCDDKSYRALVRLGSATDTYDRDGQTTHVSDHIPTQEQLEEALKEFGSEYLQTPPMFSAKKCNGKRLYELARKGIEVERKPQLVRVSIELEWYCYPDVQLTIDCSKGTYIRSIANDLGERLGSYAYVQELRRTRSGKFSVEQAISFEQLEQLNAETIRNYLYGDS